MLFIKVLLILKNKTGKIRIPYEFDVLFTIKKNINNALEDYRREGYGPGKVKDSKVFSRYLDTATRSAIYTSWLTSRTRQLQSGSALYNYIQEALKQNQIEEQSSNITSKINEIYDNQLKNFESQDDGKTLPEITNSLDVAVNKQTGKTSLVNNNKSKAFFDIANLVRQLQDLKIDAANNLIKTLNTKYLKN